MPTDVHMPATYHPENFSQTNFVRRSSTTEVKSGFLALLRPEKLRQDVRVVVYCTSLEHFAVIYPRKRLTKQVAVVNLKNTMVERADIGFIVRQKSFDNNILAKFISNERDIESWISAFTLKNTPTSQHPAVLPVLVEDEEVNN